MESNVKTRVLFVCIHHSARSQMAEALMNQIAGDEFEAHSAGIEPGIINPLAIEVLKEKEIDLSQHGVQEIFELHKTGKMFRYVIAVCDAEAAEACPIFPGGAERLHWPFADPSKFEGTHEEKLQKTREVRDHIEKKIRDFVSRSADGVNQQ